MYPKELKYLPSHEWIKVDGNTAVVGISKFAVEQLTDIVFIELPDVGDHVFANESFGEIESVKSVNDLYAPLSGEVVAVNEPIISDPSIISKDPYVKGWMIKLKLEPNQKGEKLLSADQYEKQLAADGH